MRMRHIFICGLPRSTIFLFTLSHKRHDLWGQKIYWTQIVRFWFSLQLLSETFLILRRTEQDMIKTVYGSSFLFMSDFNEIWILSIYFRKVRKYQISRKSVQWVPSCSLRTDGRANGQTDETNLTVAFFFNFANASKHKTRLYPADDNNSEWKTPTPHTRPKSFLDNS